MHSVGSNVIFLLKMFVIFCLLIQSAYCLSDVESDKKLLKKLQDYEIVNPINVAPIDNNEMFTDIYDQDDKVEESIMFMYKGQPITLDLVPNRGLFSPKLKIEQYFPLNVKTSEKKKTSKENFFFHGHLRGKEGKSNVALSSYDGYHGYFRDGDSIYFIQPLHTLENGQAERSHIVFEPENYESIPFKCGHDNGGEKYLDILSQNYNDHHFRVKRDEISERKIIELALVSDNSQYISQGSDENQTAMRAISIANVVDSIYRVNNIRVLVVFVETWSSGNPITINDDSTTTLLNFLTYKSSDLDANGIDNAQLLTRTNFTGDILGRATLKTICTTDSGGVVKDNDESNVAFTASIMAHEIGHNLGLNHDDGCSCDDPNGCIMNGALNIGTPSNTLSTCSLNDLNILLREGVATCLFNIPTQLVTDQACGNGIVEAGEQCDCGTQQECVNMNDTCCNYTTCMLYQGNMCSSGPCCDNCQFVVRGTTCRDVKNACDLPEQCTGQSEFCPEDIVVKNGISCNNDQAYCYNGLCQNHTTLCGALWTGDADVAPDICYDNLNIGGTPYGHCSMSNGEFIACNNANVKCGKLQCTGEGITPKSYSFLHNSNVTNSDNDMVQCYSFNSTGESENLGLVEDGVKCGEGMICMENSCQTLETALSGQSSCPDACNGNGICNINGNCHCNDGWTCPFCNISYSGSGYSIDSGGGCDYCASSPCVGNATCALTLDSYTCTCNSGFSGNGKVSCTEIDECGHGSHECHANANCTNNIGSYDCDCNTGYTGDGKTCTEIDYCSIASPSCSNHANCANANGTYVCTCVTGYTGNGTVCTEIDYCSTASCSDHANCTNANGTHVCTCVTGYTGNGTVCTDIDECSDLTTYCHEKANCSNAVGTYSCTSCVEGYSGNGMTCEDIKECLNTPCDPNAGCSDSDGSYTCTCNSGFTGNGETCEDINECLKTPCDPNAECSDTDGSYTCTCNSGFTGNGETCEDINECLKLPCDPNAECSDSDGSYTCTCNSGFTGNGETCEDINECESVNSCRTTSEKCVNTDGSSKCVAGYYATGVLTINETYVSQLATNSSDEYKTLAAKVRKACEETYRDQPNFEGCIVNGFASSTAGNTDANVTVVFNNVVSSPLQSLENAAATNSFGSVDLLSVKLTSLETSPVLLFSKDDVNPVKAMVIAMIPFLGVCYITAVALIITALCMQQSPHRPRYYSNRYVYDKSALGGHYSRGYHVYTR